MPLLQYKCLNCGKVFEELVKSGQGDPLCPVCGGKSRRAYEGKVYCSGIKGGGGCSGNCAACKGCKGASR